MLIAVASLVGCGTGSSGSSLLDALRKVDLSSKRPHPVKQTRVEGDMAEPGFYGPRLYPGDRRVVRRRHSRRGFEGARRVGKGYQLNFDNANLPDVTKVILGDTLHEPYIFDRRVQGKVTLSTGRPVSRTDLISLLEIVLRMNNAALVPESAGYRIVPAGEAVAGDAGIVSMVSEGEKLPAGYGISVLPLRYVSAETMIRLLQSFITRAGTLKAESSRNLLLIRGTGYQRESLIDVAISFDVNWLRGQSAGIYPLAHSSTDEIIPELKDVFQTKDGGLGKGLVRFRPVERLNAVLALTRRPETLRDVASWIRRLDRAATAGLHLYVYHVENGKATNLADVLNDVFGGGGGARRPAAASVSPGRRVARVLSRPRARLPGDVARPGPVPPTGAPKPAYRLASRPGSGRGRRPSPGAADGAGSKLRIIADEATNALLIRATRKDYRRIRAVLRRVDRAPLQVLINATIAEITLNDSLRYGVQVYLRSRDIGKGQNNGSLGWFKKGSDLLLNATFPGLNFILGSNADPRIVLDALSEVTKVKVVSSPSLVVLDNQSATLKVGDEVPITTQQSISTTDPNAPIVNSIRFRDTGVILRVTPRVNSNGLVTMEIEQEISNVTSSTEAGSLTPTISQRRIATTVAVYSGQMVVLGGLISQRSQHDKSGTPILDSIPIIGDLVGTMRNNGRRTELIVFIKPQVIRDGRDAARVAKELRGQLRSLMEPEPEHWLERLKHKVSDHLGGHDEPAKTWPAPAVQPAAPPRGAARLPEDEWVYERERQRQRYRRPRIEEPPR